MCECGESRKNHSDGTWLNPKCQGRNGLSAAKLLLNGEGSETIPLGSRGQVTPK